MNTIKSISRTAALAVGAALLCTVPLGSVAADDDNDNNDIIVRSQAAMQQWQKDTTHDLNRLLARTPAPRKRKPNNAIVQVSFVLDDDGRPTNLELANDEGNWAAERIAKVAVRRLRGLDSVPVSNPQDAQFLANIIFANSSSAHERLKERLEQSERQRIAARSDGPVYIAIGY